ncbi:hypothetical protein SDC9_53197 [bioreactor metagenome]|uniref:Uncharacterized protein n=1 Tax=bioreactor metagenome TaxID=1076179 RepID=A0A644WXY0_9ZZZZ
MFLLLCRAAPTCITTTAKLRMTLCLCPISRDCLNSLPCSAALMQNSFAHLLRNTSVRVMQNRPYITSRTGRSDLRRAFKTPWPQCFGATGSSCSLTSRKSSMSRYSPFQGSPSLMVRNASFWSKEGLEPVRLLSPSTSWSN